MMKKISAAAIAVLILTAAGCSADQSVRETTDGFWNAMDQGEIEKAAGYVSEELAEQLTSMNSAAGDLIGSTDASGFTDETKAVIDEFSANVIRITYGAHDIISLQETGKEIYEVTANVQVADPASLESALSAINYEEHLNQYQDEIISIMNNEGMQKAYSRMYELIFSDLNANIGVIAQQLIYTDQKTRMTLNKVNGSWIITAIDSDETEE